LKPVGTGAYKFIDFKPGDLLRAEINPTYHVANTPHFDSVELKGGGDAVSAARAVIQTGEFDFAWNMLVEDEILRRMEQGGKGEAIVVAGGNLEFIGINFSDPLREIDGERSHPTTVHPALSDKVVRQALNLLVDRASVEKHIYGRAGVATANFVNNPDRHKSRNTRFEFNIDKANELLDKAGWARGADGIRAKGDVKLKWLFTTATNAPRQKTQSVIKQACQKAGIELELKTVVASVFFGADVANPDTYSKFYADIQMYTTAMVQPDAALFLHQFIGTDRASKANKWQGRNIIRYNNPAFDKTHAAAQTELDPVKRAALLIQCNDIAIEDVAVVPIVYRPWIHAKANSLNAPFSGWDSPLCQLPVWHRKA
jgi:peptide/nickel transport system substrate-binding protein